jgi:hypothetical protein
MSYKDFFFRRVSGLILLRHKIKTTEGYKEKFMENNFHNLNIVMKYVFKLCGLPSYLFQTVIKYL